MTNILQLPRLGAQSSFALARNSDWLDTMFFAAPGSPPSALSLTGAIVSGSNTVTVPSTAGLIPGMPIAPIPGVPAGAYVGVIASTTFTMVNLAGTAVNATVSDAEAQFSIEPLPLDLTGIAFTAQWRSAVGGSEVFLTLQTADGSLVNGGPTGTLAFNVPESAFANIIAATYVMDIIATADGHTINLFPEGPASIVLSEGVTGAP